MPAWRSNRRDKEDRVSFSIYGFIALLIISSALIVFDRPQDRGETMIGIRSAFNDITVPILDLAALPIRGMTNIGPWWKRQMELAQENLDLKEELAEQRAWRDVALSLRDRVQLYEQALNLEAPVARNRITAWVVAEEEGPFVRSRLVGVGQQSGVRPGYPVLNVYGLVGRTVDVGRRSSRVLLLNDFNSRIAVMADRSNARAILTGDNSDYPFLEYLGDQPDIREGDRIVTSGDDNIMPRGLPIGQAVQDEDGNWRVVLFSDAAPLDLVWIWPYDPEAPPESNPAVFTDEEPDDGLSNTPASGLGEPVIAARPETTQAPVRQPDPDPEPEPQSQAQTQTSSQAQTATPAVSNTPDPEPVAAEPTPSASTLAADDLNRLQLDPESRTNLADNPIAEQSDEADPATTEEASPTDEEDEIEFTIIPATALTGTPDDALDEDTATEETDTDEDDTSENGEDDSDA